VNNSFLIEDTYIEQAQDICKYIDDNDLRNRAMANALGAKIAKEYFNEIEAEGLLVDTDSSIHNVSQILERIDISDIYINGAYVDVRLHFSDDEIQVPKSHFDLGIVPVAYMFIRISPDVASGEVTGFVLSDDVDTSIEENGFYKIDIKNLLPGESVLPYINESYDFYDESEADLAIFNYLDGALDDDSSFYALLLASQDAREKLIEASKAHNIMKFISINEDEKEAINEINDTLQDSNILSENDLGSDDVFSLQDDDTLEVLEDVGVDDEFELANLSDNDLMADEVFLSDDENIEVDSLELVDENESIDEFSEETLISNFSDEADSLEVLDDDGDINPEESFEFTTETTPSIQDIEALDEENSEDIEESIDANVEFDNQEELISNLEEDLAYEEDNDNSPILGENIEVLPEQSDYDENSEQESALLASEDELDAPAEELTNNDIVESEEALVDTTQELETLFAKNEESIEAQEVVDNVVIHKKANNKIALLTLVTIVGALGYFVYNKINDTQVALKEKPVTTTATQSKKLKNTKVNEPIVNTKVPTAKEAMPIETVENLPTTSINNEGTGISIPAIEQNLDASILVSNLTVNWDVPTNYLSNNSLKRYMTKLGKIIQLNLKTELLLLSKPPITNKILAEFEFNKSSKRLEFKNLINSSGEKEVDDVIISSIKQALAINLNINLDSVDKITGNPILVIRL